MKTKYLLLALIIIGVVSFSTGCVFSKKNTLIKDIKRFYFSYSTGNYIYGSVNYTVEFKEGKYTLSIKPDGKSEEEATVIEIDDQVIEGLLSILNKYNVKSWNGFKKSDPDVLDGGSFSISITEKDDSYTNASGYMMWPDNYHEVKEELNNLFNNIYKENE